MASITINTTAAQDARLGPACGRLLGLPGSATAQQVKDYLISHLANVVLNDEQTQAALAQRQASTPFTPT